jgi:hypothetical protein
VYSYAFAHGMQALCEDATANEAVLRALGLCTQHLQDVLLDRKVLPLGAFRPLPGCQRLPGADASVEPPMHVSLDGSAFDNLEVKPPSTSAPPSILNLTAS